MKKVQSLKTKYELWDQTLNCVRSSHIRMDEYPDGLLQELDILLFESCQEFVSYTKSRDKWIFQDSIYMNPVCLYQEVKAEKINTKFIFGIEQTNLRFGYFLQSDINYPLNFKKMKNEFWVELIKLYNVNNLEYVPNFDYNPPEEDMDLWHPARRVNSNFLNLIKNYFMLELYKPDDCLDFGWFEVSWPIETSISSVLDVAKKVFKTMYRVNYLLYKSEFPAWRKYQKKSI